jgi:ferritin-like metal-binding protein YciE
VVLHPTIATAVAATLPMASHRALVADVHHRTLTHQEPYMSKISTLQELYVDELKDLWSANDQMARALKKIAPKATEAKLKTLLADAQTGIADHTTLLKTLIEAQDGKVSKEHCKGMEGLATEALKHTIEEAPEAGPVLDAAIIAQYQRMTHYGIAGFGTVSAFARALKDKDGVKKLTAAVGDMHKGDKLMSELAESAVNIQAIEG